MPTQKTYARVTLVLSVLLALAFASAGTSMWLKTPRLWAPRIMLEETNDSKELALHSW